MGPAVNDNLAMILATCFLGVEAAICSEQFSNTHVAVQSRITCCLLLVLARRFAQGDPFHQRLRRTCYLLCRSDCYRVERLVAGWELHPLNIAAFSRRTLFAPYGESHKLSFEATRR